jgi:hypothetical protein
VNPILDFGHRQSRYVRRKRVRDWTTAAYRTKKGVDPGCVCSKRVTDRRPRRSPTTGDDYDDDDLFQITEPLFHFFLPIYRDFPGDIPRILAPTRGIVFIFLRPWEEAPLLPPIVHSRIIATFPVAF